MPNRIPKINCELDQREIGLKLAKVEQIRDGVAELHAGNGRTLERNYKPARTPARLSSLAFKDLEELTENQRAHAITAIEKIEQRPFNCGPVRVFRFDDMPGKMVVIFCEDLNSIPLIYQISVAYWK